MNRDVLLVAVVVLGTVLTRALPFLLFGRGARPAPAVRALGQALPPAVIAVLVVYCLRGTEFTRVGAFLPQLAALACVALLHLWKRNNLLSIGGGTLVYMLLLRIC